MVPRRDEIKLKGEESMRRFSTSRSRERERERALVPSQA